MRCSLPLLAPVLLVACSHPTFAATKTVDYEVPVAGVERLLCESHNGGITIVGTEDMASIRLRAEITARADSQTEADLLLHQLDVERRVADGTLQVAGKGPQDRWFRTHSFTFTITLPAQVAVQLCSHNGAVHVRGTSGDVAAESHNGRIVADTAAATVRAVSHNGDVQLSLRGALREAVVETHNGEVVVQLDDAARGRVEVETHNGEITLPDRVAELTSGKGWCKGRLGDGAGTLRVTTHNGDVVLR